MFEVRLIQLRKTKKLTQEQMAEKKVFIEQLMRIMKEDIDNQIMIH
ncbi:hypothetical protein ABQG71_06095 [Bacillus altitudinis]|uniref:HTH cro/C1-type domain-containing protein n=1 Tax=Bacillus altitudinis TaxID=293387 RepID=A0ABV1S2J4_BACAB